MPNHNKQKRHDEIMEIIKNHGCETCSRNYKRHILAHWYDIINSQLPSSRKVTSTKSLSKIFKMMKHRGIYSERFLLGKGQVLIKDNFYIYSR